MVRGWENFITAFADLFCFPLNNVLHSIISGAVGFTTTYKTILLQMKTIVNIVPYSVWYPGDSKSGCAAFKHGD